MIRPSIEYGGEIRKGNKDQVTALESIVLGVDKEIHGVEWLMNSLCP